MELVLVGDMLTEHSSEHKLIYSVIFYKTFQNGNFLGRVSMAGINTVTGSSFFPLQNPQGSLQCVSAVLCN